MESNLHPHKRAKRKIKHAGIGLVVGFGATVAHQYHLLHFLPPFVADFTIFSLHGAGIAPFCKLVFEKLKIEA